MGSACNHSEVSLRQLLTRTVAGDHLDSEVQVEEDGYVH